MNSIPAFSYLEAATSLYAFSVAMTISSVLITTGLVWLPLLSGIYRIFATTRTTDTLIDSLLTYILSVTAILFICFLPIFPVSPNIVHVNNKCEVGKTKSAFLQEKEQTLLPHESTYKTTLWWIIWQKIGSGLTKTIIDGVPCYTDHNLINTLLAAQVIENPQLKNSFRVFSQECYARAYDNYIRTGQPGETPDNLDYVGNTFFLETPGFYRSCTERSEDPQNPCYTGAHPTSVIGVPYWQGEHNYPSCRDWWLGDANNQGLQKELFKEAAGGQEFLALLGKEASGYLQPQDKDKVIRAMLDNEKSHTAFDTDLSAADALLGIVAAGIGIAFDFPGKVSQLASDLSRAYSIKKFIVFIQPLILMSLLIFFPVFFFLVSYSVKGLIAYTAAVLAVKAVPAILVISSYMTNALEPAAFGNLASKNIIDQDIFTALVAWFPVIMVVTLLLIVGYTGLNVGTLVEKAALKRLRR